MQVNVVGAGLAGCEAAFQLAERGFKVRLYEVKKIQKNEIQKTDLFGELVCSNTFRSNSLKNAVGILKAELKLLNSVVLNVAYETQIPSDDALAVDRNNFSQKLTDIISKHENIEVIDLDFCEIDENPTIIASGPLTTLKLQEAISKITGKNKLFFLDASAPIVTKESINFDEVFWASRHNQGNGNYICIPLDEEKFNAWHDELIKAEVVALPEFEKEIFFNGCQPVEILAKKGKRNLLNGPLSANKLLAPGQEKPPFAVVQLRQDDAIDSLYNIVGFQTNLKWPEQERIIKLLPGLKEAQIIRYGVLHKNNYINSPKILNPSLQVMRKKSLFFAGQITGVEGYLESVASGMVAALGMVAFLTKQKFQPLPQETVIGALTNYVTNSKHKKLKPMKANLAILPPMEQQFSDRKLKNQALCDRALASMEAYLLK
ncbi:tRNA (uracil-5-)-methyltransferase Gid [Spiroplasma sabaudiense Ar-1343]|uniref:Methylenetetrahydrofolate--tRNA-(uracil-5-)-methyltransferase TrmFO n=1 Tax=Spiroplasma sabaudiense Ar-1343 TaxID=1276257 RepID=W6AAK3_9MOLU|nr:methylenetetrahydrofolate--tRNA-(uracil(54)-C(5))-methyltransferase (FADH(2)-oxidizing) TrmFO [Spiroplasma sabaudiense]AHI54041.1 tRNA (uracil-5-)-methyltransferase Gid [Spiroplasma sabaudiense Ar-1343]